MISSLKIKLSAAFEPATSVYHGWRHFNRCVPDHKRPALAWRKIMIEAMVVQGGVFLGMGLSGINSQAADALIKAGATTLAPSVPLCIMMAATLRAYARQEISRLRQLDELRH